MTPDKNSQANKTVVRQNGKKNQNKKTNKKTQQACGDTVTKLQTQTKQFNTMYAYDSM